MKLLVNSLLLLVLMASCTSEPKKVSTNKSDEEPTITVVDKPDLSWFLGRWRDTTTFSIFDTHVLEIWTQKDGVYSGKAVSVKQPELDTSITEVVTIDTNKDTIEYAVTVMNQNKGQQIKFRLHRFNEDSILFINYAHEFPQEIIYRKLPGDSMFGIAAGFSQGQPVRRYSTFGKY